LWPFAVFEKKVGEYAVNKIMNHNSREVDASVKYRLITMAHIMGLPELTHPHNPSRNSYPIPLLWYGLEMRRKKRSEF